MGIRPAAKARLERSFDADRDAVALQDVAHDRRVGVADMRRAVHIFGLDLLVVPFFAAILAGLWRRVDEDLLPWIVAAGVAIVGSVYLPLGWHILAGGLAGGVAGLVLHAAKGSVEEKP